MSKNAVELRRTTAGIFRRTPAAEPRLDPPPDLVLGPWDVQLDDGAVVTGGMLLSSAPDIAGTNNSTVKGTFLGKPILYGTWNGNTLEIAFQTTLLGWYHLSYYAVLGVNYGSPNGDYFFFHGGHYNIVRAKGIPPDAKFVKGRIIWEDVGAPPGTWFASTYRVGAGGPD